MPNKKQKKNNNKRAPRQSREPPASATAYRGPLHLSSASTGEDLHTVEICDEAAITSDGAGKLLNVYSNDPSGSPNWSNLAAVFSEFRVLSFGVIYYPSDRFKTTLKYPPMFVVCDRDSSAALGTYSGAVQHGLACKFANLNGIFRASMKSDNSSEMAFIATSSPVGNQWIKFYAQDLTTSSQYGLLMFHWLVQFRGNI